MAPYDAGALLKADLNSKNERTATWLPVRPRLSYHRVNTAPLVLWPHWEALTNVFLGLRVAMVHPTLIASVSGAMVVVGMQEHRQSLQTTSGG